MSTTRESTEPKAAPIESPAVYLVNRNVNYEHEIWGAFTTIEAARNATEKLGPSFWITEHKLNSLGGGMHL